MLCYLCKVMFVVLMVMVIVVMDVALEGGRACMCLEKPLEMHGRSIENERSTVSFDD